MTSLNYMLPETALAECLPHLTPNERAGLVAFVDRLCQRYGANLLRVVLFGSKARGDFDDQSDLDVLVVVRMSDDAYWRHWHEIVDIAWDVGLIYSLVISAVVKSQRDYAKMRQHRALLARHIEQDGIPLWTTSPNATTSQPI